MLTPEQQESKDAILAGNRRAMARLITQLESTLPEEYRKGRELLETVLPYTGNSTRIAISGVPGVGKSTFIESFGLHLISKGHQVAVLAIDPSSSLNQSFHGLGGTFHIAHRMSSANSKILQLHHRHGKCESKSVRLE